MLKIFSPSGICQFSLVIGSYDVARSQAVEEGNIAIESENASDEILVDGSLFDVKSTWNYDRKKQINITGYKLVDGEYQYTFEEIDISEKIEAKDAEKLSYEEADKRAQRNQLLDDTDFYALSDVTMSDAMKTYRQALRDLPANKDWPNVTFPEGQANE